MKKSEGPSAMSAIGFMCGVAGSSMWLAAKAKLGMDPDKLLAAKADEYAKRAAQESFRGDVEKEARALGMKAVWESARGKRMMFEDPQMARELCRGAARQMAAFEKPGRGWERAREALNEAAEASASGGSPGRWGGGLVKGGAEGAGGLGLMMGVSGALSTLAEVEAGLRAEAGDPSWREWAGAMEEMKSTESQIAFRAWGAALEARAKGQSPAMAIKAELEQAKSRLGRVDFGAVAKEAKSKFEKSAVNNADGGRGEAFLKDLSTALGAIKQEMEASARGDGLSGRLAERREIMEAANGGSKPELSKRPGDGPGRL